MANVYSSAVGGVPSAEAIHSAAGTVILAVIAAAVVWGAIVAIAEGVARRGPAAAHTLRQAATVAAVLVVLIPVAAALIRASSIEHTVRAQWHSFIHVPETTSANTSTSSTTRLFSGAGNRYDYWRVAWSVFQDHPIAGVGAGGFTEQYFRQRHTTEAIQNPHSIELQVLSELGLVGVALLALFIAGVLIGARRLRAVAKDSPAARTAMVAATGAFVVWLVDTSGDWMHLLPGVTAIALAAVAVLCSAAGTADSDPVATASPGPSRPRAGACRRGDHGLCPRRRRREPAAYRAGAALPR